MDHGYGGGDNQFSTTSYGGQGGADGGGFMQGGGSQTTPSGKKQDQDLGLHPVTVRQLLSAQSTGGDIRIDGEICSQVCLVGQIQSVSNQSTNITYKIDDGTGVIDVKKWLDPQMKQALEDGTTAPIAQDTYVRVWGKVQEFNSKRYVGATFVRPITDFNEVSYHFLQSTLVHLQMTRGPQAGAKVGAAGPEAKDTEMGNYDTFGADLSLLSSNAKKVLNLLKTVSGGNEGMHVQEIARRLGIELNQASTAAEEIVYQGIAYTTSDDTYMLSYST